MGVTVDTTSSEADELYILTEDKFEANTLSGFKTKASSLSQLHHGYTSLF